MSPDLQGAQSSPLGPRAKGKLCLVQDLFFTTEQEFSSMSMLYNITLAMHVRTEEADMELGGTTSVHMGARRFYVYIVSILTIECVADT